MANMNFKANILPATSQGYNLGSSTQQWVIHGPIYTNGIFGTPDVDYGATLPSTATEGQIFFQTSNTVVYSVPAGGTAGYALVKDSNADGDFSWQEVAHESYSVLSAQQNGTSASLVTTGEKYNWNNAGTVKSVQVSGTSPIVSSNSASATTTLSTTISLADGYGDTKNPYASKTKNYVLAAPSNANGVPIFRAIVAADIPTLSITDKTSGTLPISRGGTNATTTAAAWTNLGGGSVGKLNLGTCATYYLANNGTWTTPPGTYVLPKATTAVLGGVTIDSDGGITVDQGAISVNWSGAPVLSVNNMTGNIELQSLTIGTKHYNGTTATVIGVTDLGLASPMTFRGVTDTTLVDGTNVTPINIVSGGTIGSYTPTSGDVVLQKTEQMEYIYSGSEWTQLGLASSYSLAEHSHGYILNDGIIEATATVALNDRLLISDASDVGRVTRSNLIFDTTSTQAALSKSGSWINYLQLSGGTMTGALKTKGLVGTLDYDYGEILPTTAVEGQLFFQISNGDDLELPSGGTAGCALVKNSNASGDYSWKYVVPTGGTAGYALVKASASDGDVTWAPAVPSGGTTGQALVKNSNTNGDTKWATISADDRVLKAGDTMTGQLTAGSHLVAYTTTPGNAYNASGSAIQIREVNCVGTGQSDWSYAPKIGFHWSGRVAVQLGLNTSQELCLYANNSTTLGKFRAGQVWGAVWNDYAEFRKDNIEEKELQQPGRCVKENGNGILSLTQARLERGCEIISDTFGFSIGQDEENGYNTPIASNGRVLAYPYESIEEFKNHIGWPVCSGPNGTVSIMTEEEEEQYPSRIIGTISEIPDYQIWGSGNVEVNNRIWIRIK